jgi:hypothetical protein
MSSKDMPSDFYFSGSYQEGRQKFLNLCADNRLSVSSYVHPHHKGPDGEKLAMDCVWMGAKDAKKVLFATCGTHGLEASTGASTMAQFLSNGAIQKIPDDVAVLLVHAVNPYGWAYDQRGNEDGIDLNRNCLDHRQIYPANPIYDDLHTMIKQAEVDKKGLASFTKAFHEYGDVHGAAQAVSGITAGQYKYANGMSFGGTALSWSCQTLFDIAERYLSHADQITMIDWHTGIGDFGQPFFIMDDLISSPSVARATAWWHPHAIHCDDILEGSSPDYSGLLIKGLKEKIKSIYNVHITSVVIEWGTYNLDMMLQALLMDDWLKTHRLIADPDMVERVRALLVDRFCPSNTDWRQAVLSQAPPIYLQALKGLQSG